MILSAIDDDVAFRSLTLADGVVERRTRSI